VDLLGNRNLSNLSGTLCSLLLIPCSRFLFLIVIAGCSVGPKDEDGGSSSASSSDFGGNRQDVTGSITSQNGSQSAMKNWVVFLAEKNNGTGRVAVANESGALQFSKLSLGSSMTGILLSPDFLLQSVMSMPTTKANAVRQYFQLGKTTMPRLVQKGGILTFQTFDGVTVEDSYAKDSDGDQIPDGIASLSLADGSTVSKTGLKLTDSDADGVDNDTDFDIDGDGLPNIVDADDDGDGTPDVFDADANGNGVSDTKETLSDAHFKTGLEYVVVQEVKTTAATKFKFIAKARDGVTVSALKIKGPDSLLTGSKYTSTDAADQDWDMALADDGKNNDGAATDKIYGRTVTLGSGLSPRANQMLFFDLTTTSGGAEFTASFPYLLPDVTMVMPTTSYAASTRVVTLTGDPFGASRQDFTWIVTVNNSDGIRVYESNPVAGSNRTLTLPANIIQSGKTYTYMVTAQSTEKISGYPALIVETESASLQ
jgi:hypothetical protein